MERNSNRVQHFPSKILLFGEYGIVAGGSGLAIPFPAFSGMLGFDYSDPVAQSQSNQSVLKLADCIVKERKRFRFLDVDRLVEDAHNGLWFNSSIPLGYGLGSSGALVAAIYDRYRNVTIADVRKEKEYLARIEAFFHGSSSGVDPTVSFFGKPVAMHDDVIEFLDSWPTDRLGFSVFFVDSGEKGQTRQLVDWFKSKMLQDEFRHFTFENYLKVNQRIVDGLLLGNSPEMSDLLTISNYQLDYLIPMIPDSFRTHFVAGIDSRDFVFKLCGSGGGGYMLCLAKNSEKAIHYFEQERLSFIEL